MTETTGSTLKSARDNLPILVGVVGPRVLTDAERQTFRDRLRSLITDLDARLPHTPKVLISGGGPGVDLEAVRVALAEESGAPRHPAWSAVVALPMDAALHREGFAASGSAEDLAFLETLIAGRPRVLVKQLRHLTREPYDDSRLEPDSLQRVAAPALTLAHGEKAEAARAEHHDQFALWLARYATIFIVATLATPEAEAHAPGGYARAVAFRRAGAFDAASDAIVARSLELLTGSPLDEPDGGYVLVLDGSAPRPGSRRLLGALEPPPGARVLRPIQMLFDTRHDHADIGAARERIAREPLRDEPEPGEDVEARLRGAFACANGFEKMHARRGGGPLKPAPFGDEHPAAFLEAAREADAALGLQQTTATYWTRLAQRWSASFFVLAIVSYETYTELTHDRPPALLLYIAFLVAILGIVIAVRWTQVQVRAEDYRGLREMMRVQIHWWSAGVDRMVDRVHLRTINNDLRLTREAMATLGMWALLRNAKTKTLDLPPRLDDLGQDRGPALATKWIKEQREYFRTQSRAQYGAKRLADTSFVVALLSALCALTTLFVLLYGKGYANMEAALGQSLLAARVATPLFATLAAMGLLWTITGSCWGSGDRAHELADMRRGWRAGKSNLSPLAFALGPHGALALIPTFALLALMALALAAIGLDIASLMDRFSPPDATRPLIPWAGQTAFLALLAILTIIRIPDRSSRFRVKKFNIARYAVAVVLATATQIAVAATFAGTVRLLREDLSPFVVAPLPVADGDVEAFHAILLAVALILLTGAGMIRWYTERRNHLAQAEHYSDMFRVFRRAEEWLSRAETPFRIEEREQLLELGIIALDESEAWLKAHRERPSEAIAG